MGESRTTTKYRLMYHGTESTSVILESTNILQIRVNGLVDIPRMYFSCWTLLDVPTSSIGVVEEMRTKLQLLVIVDV